MAEPGDSVYKIGTIHFNLSTGCAVELHQGVQAKDGTAQFTMTMLPLELDAALGSGATLASVLTIVEEAVAGLVAERFPGLVEYTPPATPKEG